MYAAAHGTIQTIILVLIIYIPVIILLTSADIIQCKRYWRNGLVPPYFMS